MRMIYLHENLIIYKSSVENMSGKSNISEFHCSSLTLSWRRPLSYRSQLIDLVCISMDWFLYDRDPVTKELINRHNQSLYNL